MDNNKHRITENAHAHNGSVRPFATNASPRKEHRENTEASNMRSENHDSQSQIRISDKQLKASVNKKTNAKGKVLHHSQASENGKYNSSDKNSGKGALFTLIIIVLTGIVAIMLYFFTSVKTIRVLGCSAFSEENVINLSGLYTGKNLYSYNLKEAEANIELNPYIEVVSIERQFPSTLCINIRERIEHAAIAGPNDHYCILDETGFILHIGHRTSAEGLILIEGLGTSGFSVGTAVDIDKSILRTYTLVELLSATSERADEILSIDLSNTANIKIKTASGFTVILGDSLNIKEKISRMFDALDEWSVTHPEGGILYINESGMTDYSKGTPEPTAVPTDTQSPDPNTTSTPEPTPEV